MSLAETPSREYAVTHLNLEGEQYDQFAELMEMNTTEWPPALRSFLSRVSARYSSNFEILYEVVAAFVLGRDYAGVPLNPDQP